MSILHSPFGGDTFLHGSGDCDSAAAPDFPPSSLSPEAKTCQRASMQTLCVIIEQGNRKWGSLRSAGRAVFKRFENVAFAQWCCRPPFLCSLGAIHSHFLCKSSTERPREDIMKTLSCSLWNVAVGFLSAETGSLFRPVSPPFVPSCWLLSSTFCLQVPCAGPSSGTVVPLLSVRISITKAPQLGRRQTGSNSPCCPPTCLFSRSTTCNIPSWQVKNNSVTGIRLQTLTSILHFRSHIAQD